MPTPLMMSPTRVLVSWVFAGSVAMAAPIDQITPMSLPARESVPVRADLQVDKATVQTGQPVWVTFMLTNLSGEPVALKVPDVPAVENASGEVGLPLAHVFSGPRYTGVTIRDSRGEDWDTQVVLRPRGSAPLIRLAPHASVGL